MVNVTKARDFGSGSPTNWAVFTWRDGGGGSFLGDDSSSYGRSFLGDDSSSYGISFLGSSYGLLIE